MEKFTSTSTHVIKCNMMGLLQWLGSVCHDLMFTFNFADTLLIKKEKRRKYKKKETGKLNMNKQDSLFILVSGIENG